MSKRLAQLLDRLGWNARKSFKGHCCRQNFQLIEQWLAFGGQMQPPRAPIIRIAAALDQSGFFEPIDDSAQGNRLDVEVIGKLDLSKPRLATEPSKHAPLRASHAKRCGAAVKRTAQAERGFSVGLMNKLANQGVKLPLKKEGG